MVVVEVVTPIGYDPAAQRVEVEDLSNQWEAELLAHDYLFAAADGLNRWFVRREDEGLLEHFRFPVNALDDYVPYSLVSAQQQVSEQHARVQALDQQLQEMVSRHALGEAKVSELQVQLVDATARGDHLQQQLDAAQSLAALDEARSSARLSELEAKVVEATARYDEMVMSTSWKVTAPMRAVTSWLKRRRLGAVQRRSP